MRALTKILAFRQQGVVPKCSSALATGAKVRVKSAAFASCKRFSKALSSPIRKWVPDFLQLGKVKTMMKRSGASTQLHRCRCKLALWQPLTHKAIMGSGNNSYHCLAFDVFTFIWCGCRFKYNRFFPQCSREHYE